MKEIKLEEKYILEYIKYMISSFKMKPIEVNNAKYHHNTSYSNAQLVLKHGILSVSELNRLGIKKYSPEILNLWSDIESHINGIDSISLSVVGLTDLYEDEFEYNPFSPTDVDLNISSDIRAGRSSIHYGNEFLCREKIGVDKIKSIDIRLLQLIEKEKNFPIKDIISRYNFLRDIALTIKENNLDIPFREMSNDNYALDIVKVSEMPKLILK